MMTGGEFPGIFAEGLLDRQAADAVCSRIDWTYALSLELTEPGFDHMVLSEFRTRLVAGQAEQLLLETLLSQLRARGLLKIRGRQRTDSTHVLAAIRVLNRLELVGETLRHALNSLAVVAPDWLRGQAPPAWFDRYGRRIENYPLPKTAAAREALAAHRRRWPAAPAGGGGRYRPSLAAGDPRRPDLAAGLGRAVYGATRTTALA
jgi:transposase